MVRGQHPLRLDRPAVDPGDIVETPLGDQEVIQLDHRRDTILTEDPKTRLILEWKAEEIEEVAQPDTSDPDAVERWLRIKAVIVPSLEITTTTIRCLDSCPCSSCYRIHKHLSARGTAPRTEITHHVDNETCQCARLPECACMGAVNIRWASPR